MKIAVFGLTISSSWGNGHATLWRGLCRALARLGHQVTFFERDASYYAANRDMVALPGGELIFYASWEDVQPKAKQAIADADAAIVTSYCPDATAASELILSGSRARGVFYDLDTPVTLSCQHRGEEIPYIGQRGLADFDLVLSYTGGAALDALRKRFGARRVVPIYGHVDPDVHRPAAAVPHYRCDLSYLGTYSADRQEALAALFIAPAEGQPHRRFVMGGAQYPAQFPWLPNIFFVRHLPPSEHPAFFSSSRLTLNVTRRPMAELGWCPSGRLFEAAACGTAIVTDTWDGLDAFFVPGEEIFTARTSDEVTAVLDLADADINKIAAAGRERTLAEHNSARRARELIAALEQANTPATEALGA